MRHCLIAVCLLIAYLGMALWRGGTDFAWFLPDWREMFLVGLWAASVGFFLWVVAGRPKLS
jgi:hypothetical protein